MKPRLRLTRIGWFKFWCRFLTGTKDFYTGQIYPDEHGHTEREIWIGPFATPEEAFRSN